jgi:hypothetical protein
MTLMFSFTFVVRQKRLVVGFVGGLEAQPESGAVAQLATLGQKHDPVIHDKSYAFLIV